MFKHSITSRIAGFSLVAIAFFTMACSRLLADDSGWILLTEGYSFDDWHQPHTGWSVAADASLDESGRRFETLPGEGTYVCRGDYTDANLVSAMEFTDVHVELEFMIGRDSNSGLKLNGMYEIQIADTHKKVRPLGDDCGGIYPRGELEPRYHVIDIGYPPSRNAARPAGDWQTLQLDFYSPRFNKGGLRVQRARLERVVLNGQMVHDSVELAHPTGAAWSRQSEQPRGPLLLQGDHGPVAFRRIRVKPLN